MSQFYLDQDSYAFYSDGTESGSVIIGSVNTGITVGNGPGSQKAFGDLILIRHLLQEYGGKAGSAAFDLYVQKNGTGGYLPITSVTGVSRANSSNMTNGDDTTQRIGSGTFVSNNNGVGDQTVTGSCSFGISNESNTLFSIQFDLADCNDADYFDFRVVKTGGTALDSYTRDGRVTISKTSPIDISLGQASLTATGQTLSVETNLEISLSAASITATGQTVTPSSVAPVYTIATGISLKGQDLGYGYNWNGPFIDSNGNMYVLTVDGTSDNLLKMYKSANGGQTWTEQDTGNRPANNSLVVGSVDCHKEIINNRIYIAVFANVDEVYFHTFRVSTEGSNPDTWDTIDKLVDGPFTNTGAQLEVGITVGDTSSDIFIVAAGEVSGTNENCYYYYSTNGGTNWSSAAAFDDQNDSYDNLAIAALYLNGNVYGFWLRDDTNNYYGRYATDVDQSFSGHTNQGDYAHSIQNDLTKVTGYMSGTDEVIVSINLTTTNIARSVHWYNQGTPDASVQVTSTVIYVHDGGSGAHGVVAQLVKYGTTVYYVFANNADQDVYIINNPDDAGWTGETEVWDAVNAVAITANIFEQSGKVVLGIVIDDGGFAGTLRYMKYVLGDVVNDIEISLNAAGVTATGQTLTVERDLSVSLGAAGITATGQVLSVERDLSVSLSNAAIAATGQALTVDAPMTIALSYGALTASGQVLTPQIGLSVSLNSATLTATGQVLTPQIDLSVLLNPATLTLTGQQLSVQEDLSVALSSASLTLTGQSLTVLANTFIDLLNASITAQGQALTVVANIIIDLSYATVTTTGQTLSVVSGVLVSLNNAILTATGQALTVDAPITVSLLSASITATGQALTVSATGDVTIVLSSASLSATGQVLSPKTKQTISLSNASLSATGQTINVKGQDIILLDEATVSLSGPFSVPKAFQELIFKDGFETGDFSQWDYVQPDSGKLTVTTSAAIHQNYGANALLDNTNPKYVRDATPHYEKRMRIRFYIDISGITMASGDTFYLLWLQDPWSQPNSRVYLVVLNYWQPTDTYSVRQLATEDDKILSGGAFYAIPKGINYIEIDWKASSNPGADDGYAKLWANGVLKETLSTLDNDTEVIDYVNFGVVSGLDAGTTGNIQFDAYHSVRTQYIGPAFVPLSASSITATGQTLSVRIGENIHLSTATLTATGQALSVETTVVIPLGYATITTQGQTVSPELDVSVSLSSASLTATGQTTIPKSLPELILDDDFETGDFSKWDIEIDEDWNGNPDTEFEVTNAAAVNGSFGVEANIYREDQRQYIQTNLPYHEKRIRMRVYFNPNSIYLDPGPGAEEHIIIFSCYLATIYLYTDLSMNYQIVIHSQLDSGYVESSRIDIEDKWSIFEVDAKSATNLVSNDGYVRVWVDEVMVYEVTNLNNDKMDADYAIVGPGLINDGMNGVPYWDEVRIQRSQYIGKAFIPLDASEILVEGQDIDVYTPEIAEARVSRGPHGRIQRQAVSPRVQRAFMRFVLPEIDEKDLDEIEEILSIVDGEYEQ